MKKYLIAAACSLGFVWIGCGESAQTVHPVQSADFAAYIAVQEALAGLAPDERAVLNDLLRRVVANLEAGGRDLPE